MAANPLIPDAAQAMEFLSQLTVTNPEGILTFQSIPERPDIKGMKSGRILHGNFEDVALELGSLNKIGHGIFVMINEGNGKGRKKEHILRVRSYFVDLDGAPIQPVLDAELQPHILVESSPKKWHAYWLADSCPLDQFKERQHALAKRFGGDMSVCDLPRIMRLPGFWHQKGAPFLTRLVHPSAYGEK